MGPAPDPSYAAFEDVGAGARAPGMGNAFAAVADDVYAIHYNPAGLALLERPMLGTSYSKLFWGLSDGSNISDSFIGYAHPLPVGPGGTLATAWESFSLNGSLYQDQSLGLAYGRAMPLKPWGGDLYGGLTLKYLYSSFGAAPEASNAVDNTQGPGFLTGKSDPILSGGRSRGAVDADAGFLYRFLRNYSLGLSLANLNQPNVAFSPADTDRLPLGIKLGLGYRSLISNITAEADSARGPTGQRDNVFTAAAERWFPKLFVGDFGLRGALSIGSRSFTQAAAGVSYRTRRLEFDYGLAMPINTVASTAGTHRFAVGFRFGPASEEEESLEMVLEAMRQLKTGQPSTYNAEAKGLTLSEKATLDEYLAQARTAELGARYKDALDKLSAAMGVAPADKMLIAKFSRLNFAAQQIPKLPDYKSDPMQAALHQGLLAYLSGDDRAAIDKISEALAIKPDYHELDLFLTQLERVTGLQRPAIHPPSAPLSYSAQAALTKANTAIQERRYQDAIDLSMQVLHEDVNNATAWENLGTAYFAMKDLEAALDAWKRAYSVEKEPSIRSAIKGYIRSIERLQSKGLIHPNAPRPAAAPRPEFPAPRPAMTAEQEQSLYNDGVDAYARRDFQKAKEDFQKILQADPDNLEAQKALKRVMEELR